MDFNLLCHYYEVARGPFHNLSALSIEEADSILSELRENGRGFASKRSEDYMQIRRQLEKQARMMFVEQGGNPRTLYPHYMTLGQSHWLLEWYEEGRELQIYIDDFDASTISFTYGDLFPTMRVEDGKPYRKKVYTRDTIQQVVEQFGWPQQWNSHGQYGPERYIEVQIWDDRVIERYRNKWINTEHADIYDFEGRTMV
ncbi:hypothetical protein [Paenibacillus alvei]|uniref:Uncharacterized protein n=1 Tax=Paenibacillus alvei TaxID=44250 RepID=A0A383R9P6_PAEAL|nr:hypothetical protein [Paenibacillus alvei]SYX83302.1 conserved protein of unknown function [Paenibacillus alvei]